MNGLATGCFLDSHIHTVLGLQGQVVHSTVLGWHKTTQGVAILVVNGSTCCQNACITHPIIIQVYTKLPHFCGVSLKTSWLLAIVKAHKLKL